MFQLDQDLRAPIKMEVCYARDIGSLDVCQINTTKDNAPFSLSLNDRL